MSTNRLALGMAALGFALAASLTRPAAAEENGGAGRPVIVLAAFGTSVPAAQACLEAIDTAVREAFPRHEVRWALTAQFIIDKLRKRGQTTLFARKVPIQNLAEVFADLRTEGETDVVVQSLHVVPGGEYNELLAVPHDGLRVRYGLPLLADAAMRARFAGILSERFGGPDAVTILCGHGNDRHPEYNAELIELDRLVRSRYEHVYVATVEGRPGTEKAFADARASGKAKVRFVPIMVVAGDHVMNDVMGDDPESWKSVLGLPATCAGGLGLHPEVVQLYIERLRTALHD